MLVGMLRGAWRGPTAWVLMGLMLLAVAGAKSAMIPLFVAGLCGTVLVMLVVHRRIPWRVAGLAALSLGAFAVATVVFYGTGSRAVSFGPFQLADNQALALRLVGARPTGRHLGAADADAGVRRRRAGPAGRRYRALRPRRLAPADRVGAARLPGLRAGRGDPVLAPELRAGLLPLQRRRARHAPGRAGLGPRRRPGHPPRRRRAGRRRWPSVSSRRCSSPRSPPRRRSSGGRAATPRASSAASSCRSASRWGSLCSRRRVRRALPAVPRCAARRSPWRSRCCWACACPTRWPGSRHLLDGAGAPAHRGRADDPARRASRPPPGCATTAPPTSWSPPTCTPGCRAADSPTRAPSGSRPGASARARPGLGVRRARPRSACPPTSAPTARAARRSGTAAMLALNDEVFKSPTEENLRELHEKYGVDWLFADRARSPTSALCASWWIERYRRRQVLRLPDRPG